MWQLVEAQRLGPILKQQFAGDLTTTGTFVKMKLRVENRSKQPVSITPPDIFDDQGRTYQISRRAQLANAAEGTILISKSLNPNVGYFLSFIYDVPNDAKGLTIPVRDLSTTRDIEGAIALGF